MKSILASVLLPLVCGSVFAMAPSPVADSAGVVRSEFVYDRAEFPSCHAATIAETSRGELMIAFFGGKHESSSDCSIWTTRFRDGRWESPVLAADGMVDGVKTACWNPVLFQIPDGDLLLFYKVGTSVQEWTGWLVRSSDGGYTWSEPERLPDNILGPIKNKPLLTEDGRLLCGTSLERGGWRAYVEITDADVSHWRTVGPLNDRKSHIQLIQPSFLRHRDGELQMLCRSIDIRGDIFTLFSGDGGETWGEPVSTGLPNNDSGLDAVSLKDGRFLLVYNHIQASRDGAAARSPLNIALSGNGRDWYSALVLEDSPGDEFSYPAVIQTEDSLVHVVYTWHRECIKHVVLDPSAIRIDPSRKITDGQWVEDPVALEEEYGAAADSILGMMSTAEKLDFLSGKWAPHDRGTHDLYGGGNDRLSLPRFRMEYGQEGIHTNGKATMYPCPLALAATFDNDLISRVAASVAEDSKARGIDVIIGPELMLYSREDAGLQSGTFGDDPEYASECAVAWAEGLAKAGVMPAGRYCPAGDVASEDAERFLARALPAYGGVVLRGSAGETKVVEDSALTLGLMRGECGFDGLLIPDIWETGSALPAFKAGLNMDLPKGEYFNAEVLGRLLSSGQISQEEVDARVHQLLVAMLRYGLMSGTCIPDRRIPENRPESRAVAAEAAARSAVLLKNDGDILPLGDSRQNILVLGNMVHDNPERPSGISVYPYENITLADALDGKTGFGILPEPECYIDLTRTGEFFADNSRRSAGLKTEYFPDAGMSGAASAGGIEKYADYAWGGHPPVTGFPATGYSARWSGVYSPAADAIVKFTLSSHGDARLFIDGEEVCVSGTDAAQKSKYIFRAEKGKAYDIRLEFVASRQDPEIQLVYASVEAAGLEKRLKAADRIVLSLGRDGSHDPEPEFWASLVSEYGKKTVAVIQSCDTDDLSLADHAAASLLVWNAGQYAGRAVADILTGAVSPAGKMPLSAAGYPFGYGLTYGGVLSE